MNTQEKMISVDKSEEVHKIVVTHVTIRQSITFLLLKLIGIEVVAAACVILFHSLIITTNITAVAETVTGDFSLFNVWVFILLVLVKTIFVILVIIIWLNEYYEITPKEVIYRKGLLFKREERIMLEHLSTLELEQGLLGRVCNYGSIKVFNWAQEKSIILYLIHNPRKYHHILETLLPPTDMKKKVFKEHLIDPDEI